MNDLSLRPHWPDWLRRPDCRTHLDSAVNRVPMDGWPDPEVVYYGPNSPAPFTLAVRGRARDPRAAGLLTDEIPPELGLEDVPV